MVRLRRWEDAFRISAVAGSPPSPRPIGSLAGIGLSGAALERRLTELVRSRGERRVLSIGRNVSDAARPVLVSITDDLDGLRRHCASARRGAIPGRPVVRGAHRMWDEPPQSGPFLNRLSIECVQYTDPRDWRNPRCQRRSGRRRRKAVPR